MRAVSLLPALIAISLLHSVMALGSFPQGMLNLVLNNTLDPASRQHATLPYRLTFQLHVTVAPDMDLSECSQQLLDFAYDTRLALEVVFLRNDQVGTFMLTGGSAQWGAEVPTKLRSQGLRTSAQLR
jgi:hypothetical protein